MENVENIILYQVATDRNYKVGDVIEFSSELNGNGYRVYNSKFNDGKEAYHKVGFNYANSKKIFKNKNLIVNMSKSLSESDFVLRELAAEEVRKEKYPEYPSRLKCMFLSEKKETALENLKDFYKSGKGKLFQAIAVELEGNLFYARSKGLQRNGSSYGEYLKIADEYWSQNQKSKEEAKEILFVGKAKVVEILKEMKLEK